MSTPTNEIKTDKKKQHFEDIYVATTPVPFKKRILDELEYISDDFNRAMFDEHILPHLLATAADESSSQPVTIPIVDLCSCFGNTTMACVRGMSYREICDNWKDETTCQEIQKPARFPSHVTAVDISAPAMAYGKSVGLYDTTIVANLNDRSTHPFLQTVEAMKSARVLISTAALVYLDLETIDELVHAFACADSSNSDGYALVNFLNPFAVEKSDQSKQILLKHLDFVASRATRHRKMSALEQTHYPGEEWVLLELWVLKRRPRA